MCSQESDPAYVYGRWLGCGRAPLACSKNSRQPVLRQRGQMGGRFESGAIFRGGAPNRSSLFNHSGSNSGEVKSFVVYCFFTGTGSFGPDRSAAAKLLARRRTSMVMDQNSPCFKGKSITNCFSGARAAGSCGDEPVGAGLPGRRDEVSSKRRAPRSRGVVLQERRVRRSGRCSSGRGRPPSPAIRRWVFLRRSVSSRVPFRRLEILSWDRR